MEFSRRGHGRRGDAQHPRGPHPQLNSKGLPHMEIKTAEYNVWNEGSTIHYEGTLRLSGTDAYQPILELMQKVLAEKPQNVVLDLTQLEFLNSSGINLLA